eukprot:365522-Chlamydomonas_euryale.AAC.1
MRRKGERVKCGHHNIRAAAIAVADGRMDCDSEARAQMKQGVRQGDEGGCAERGLGKVCGREMREGVQQGGGPQERHAAAGIHTCCVLKACRAKATPQPWHQ